ncbi:MotE family protein [Pelagibius litoralis]|uniref:MotE family protein n=1 Tax=Pelagibius litoralis TaxID=374515 RepID=A0A967K6U0_9PROT|nr:MotE family protein [Pelagibius litoralis]NIA69448.1 MotE family protein [Pelagibius litoralis]
MRLRLLPVFILIAGLGMTAKLAGIWQGVGGPTLALAAEPADAAASTGDAPQELATVADTPVPAGQITDLSSDLFDLTDEELGLLQALSQRREELEQRAREVDEREVLLKAAEQRIEQKIRELEGLQQSIEALLVEHDEQSETQMKSLVKIYESMKPKQAARIFEELDMEVLLEVIERMKERKSAPILAQMNPQRAKTVTLELAQRRELPIPRN